ncbi:MAG TPA: hypothetical protein VKT22_01825 [Steroidobacteraceae bacterium]|nr:hypothetical protein [Steroidobacteraceae bacterium]
MRKDVIGAALLALLAPIAHADGDYMSPTEDRVRISLGVMDLKNSTTFRVDSSTGVQGTTIDAENQFGLDEKDIEPKFQATVRAGERNRLRLDYFYLDRTGNQTVSEPIVFRDAVLQQGEPLQSTLDLRLLGLTYGYSFLHGQRYEVAATLGVWSVGINAQAKVVTQAVHIDQRETAAGPYPTPGLDATFVVTRHFYLDGRVQYLGVHVHQLDGSLGFAELNALYRFTPNVSLALGYIDTRAKLTSTKTGSSGYFNFDSKGPQLFVRVSF